MPSDIWSINSRRASLKIPVVSLCVQAGVGRQTFYDAMEGVTAATPATIKRLAHALERFKLKSAGDPSSMSCHACYKMALVVAAGELKRDARAALFSDPARRATADKEWLSAAHTRQLAYLITNQMIGFKITEVAAAAGVTKQAVSQAIKDIENDPAMAAIIQHLEEMFS